MSDTQIKTVPQCRFCKADSSEQSVKGEFVYGGNSQQHFWECDACRMIYLFPTLSEKEEEEFYKRDFEKFMSNRVGKDMNWSGPEKHFQANQREVERRMPFLKRHIEGISNVLEIGCSSGFMLSALKDFGLDVYGLEPSGVFKEYVHAKEIAVYDDIEQLVGECDKKTFDLIIHYYVFEHIRDPLQFIDRYMGLLGDHGKMIFEIPCGTDPLVELYKIPSFDKFYWSVVHHWYYTKTSLENVLKKTGFKFELFPEQRYDLSNHMAWMQDGKPGGLGKYSHVFGPELDRMYKEQLKKNWLCDTIIAVISK